MLEQVDNFDQKIKFIIGFAGSGKSTKLAQMVNEDTLVLTPTHKAASVLIQKGICNVYTIHSILKLVPTINKDFDPSKHRMQRLKQIGDTDLSKIKQVFIDEYSMLSQDILDLLLASLPVHAQVIVFGDAQQLPPVSGTAIDPLIYTDDIEELTIQHRAEAPEVVETFMRFVQYIRTQDNTLSLRLNPAIKHGNLDDFNPATDRILAYTNKKVSELNSLAAQTLNLSSDYCRGEKLTANQVECTMHTMKPALSPYPELFPGCIAKGKLLPIEELLTTARSIRRDIDKWNTLKHIAQFPQCDITVGDNSYNIYYDTNHYQTQKALVAEVEKRQRFIYKTYQIPSDIKLSVWCSQNRLKPGVEERGQAWARQIAHSSLVFSLQRPFATTIHKAQGSEFSTVYIAQNDIKKSIRNNYYMQYARLMYVALSRAKNKIIILN